MTWIRTVPLSEPTTAFAKPWKRKWDCTPRNMRQPSDPNRDPNDGIVASHSLIPEALEHAFSTFGALMSPDLPLSRRHHEMIATMVSVTNRCVY